MSKIILITGATSGIGRSCAFRFAKGGHTIIMVGRRKDRLESIADDIREKYGTYIKTLAIDVSSRLQVENAIDSLPDDLLKIDVLINNAGLALGLNAIHEGLPEQWETMIDTNIKGLLFVTHAVVPLMIKNGKGHVINIGSIAGRETYASGNVYCATKAAVDSLTKAMRIDLVRENIKVTQVAPGSVETEFSMVRFSGDENAAKAVYEGFEPLSPDDVADVVYYVTTLPPHVNINDLLIMPTAQASASVIHRKKS